MTELGDVKPDETIDYSSIKPITLPIDKEYHTFIAYKAGDPDMQWSCITDSRIVRR